MADTSAHPLPKKGGSPIFGTSISPARELNVVAMENALATHTEPSAKLTTAHGAHHHDGDP